MTVKLSVRVEFLDKVDHEHRGRGLRAGSAVQEDAFEGVAIPRAGELVSAIGLFGHELARLIQPRDAGSFVRVARVEHCPVSLPGDGRTLDGRDWATPTAFLVLHLQAPSDDRSIKC